MCNRDQEMKRLNGLVEDFQSIIRTTEIGSVEREKAGIIYTTILNLVTTGSGNTFNLNKIHPHTLYFLSQRGLKIRTQRAGNTKSRKKKSKRRKRLGLDLSI